MKRSQTKAGPSKRQLRISFQCMFCGKTIEEKQPDPCIVILCSGWDTPGEKPLNQQCYCHAACLRQVAHQSVPLYVLDRQRKD
ncbi:hypothetical protein HY572_07120 [Candidatus Micrarchaeota archaeon]|nr:hypothetical protein [Candidatus Micrarchaeota archaeon]